MSVKGQAGQHLGTRFTERAKEDIRCRYLQRFFPHSAPYLRGSGWRSHARHHTPRGVTFLRDDGRWLVLVVGRAQGVHERVILVLLVLFVIKASGRRRRLRPSAGRAELGARGSVADLARMQRLDGVTHAEIRAGKPPESAKSVCLTMCANLNSASTGRPHGRGDAVSDLPSNF